MAGYVRFKYVRRSIALGVYPATNPLNNRPRDGKGPALKLPQRWIDWVSKSNSPATAAYLLRAHSGWVNTVNADGEPFAESLTMGGNIAQIDRVEDEFIKVLTLTPDSPLPEFPNPLLIHKFTCLSSNGQIRLPGTGFDAWFPFLFAGEAWISVKNVELFDDLPEPIWPGVEPGDLLPGYAAMITKGTRVLQAPDGVKLYVVDRDTDCRVTSEVHGWGKIGERRWVDLSRVRRME